LTVNQEAMCLFLTAGEGEDFTSAMQDGIGTALVTQTCDEVTPQNVARFFYSGAINFQSL